METSPRYYPLTEKRIPAQRKSASDQKKRSQLLTPFLLALPVIILLIALISASGSENSVSDFNNTAPVGAARPTPSANTSTHLLNNIQRPSGRIPKVVPEP